MKIAFSNVACSELPRDALLTRAKAWGYDGVELKFLDGRFDLTEAPSLADAEGIRSKLSAAGLTLVALHSSLALCDADPRSLAAKAQKLRSYISLAHRLGGPYVVIAGDVLSPRASRARAVERMIAALREIAVEAAERQVTLVLENIGDLASSRVLWMVHDAVRLPSVQVCLNQVNACVVGERPSLTVPRLGRKLAMVRVSDATFRDDRLIDSYVEVGKGQAEVSRMIELLRGIAFDGWLSVEWPRMWQTSLAPAETALPAAAKFLRSELARAPVVLSAYKGDKNAPRFAGRGAPVGAK
ncbi:MAG: hypothetical protein CHACPFDD_03953 [Phycisphaerae bacterium]|nr:hypothetical protein [Phycisphaerae bacterium]